MASPFIYEQPVPPDRVLDRDAELALLLDRVLDGRNSRLEAPRRYGKTSLLRKLLAEAAGERVPVYVNFLGVLTPADVAERLERAYREQLDSRLRQWFTGLVRTLRPTVGSGPALPVGVQVSPVAPEAGLLDRLAVPRRLFEKHGRRCAIVFDEFQDVLRAGDRLDEVFRSEIEQHGDAAAYVFSGSHPGLMRELFATRRRAFYGQAAPVDLGPLDAADLAEFIGREFAAGERDPGTALEPLLELAAGHPQRAMLLAHHLYEATAPGAPADSDDWARALAAAFREVDGEVQELWRGLTATQQRVIALIADERTRVNAAQARELYGRPKTGANRQAIETLEARGEIAAASTPSGRQVVDPLLRQWLAGGRRWPDG
jgi:uncharacterized protein